MARGVVVAIVQAFLAMNGTMQNDVFGRTKKESNELPNPPLTSHMVRVKQSNFGYFLGTPPWPLTPDHSDVDPLLTFAPRVLQCARPCRGVTPCARTPASSSSPTPRFVVLCWLEASPQLCWMVTGD